ncbi:sigma 54-interacting transcriptional regulator [Mitsuaria sp. WAJ17]|uniref:sigma 54-interacting transcriptional regulator n=1 Tax=Mitsuaria sp. WAJ17 TaxID=2761452 RepID=UPI001602F18D|nr:sigma 54-interacting transcriptional regulator [Mitsuaria sp. WAJ17]MBB2487638.1 sigma 54-interacting transcriptional regulator [Mitsuaria sp. WAJ17]
MAHALIVDDDGDSVESLQALIAAEQFTVSVAHSLRDARRHMALQQPDLILLDLELPDGNGMDLFTDPQLVANSEVVLITGHASLETSIQALRLGAADYLVKPINLRHLLGVLSRVTRPAVLKAEVADLNAHLAEDGNFGHLWGRAPAMLPVYEQISRVAGTGVSVFILGESGTGKELVAQTVHDLSRRRKKPFLAVNCGAISPNLIESEIFGHEKGAFTGADHQHQGFFERASGGTLFLDELTEMPLELQVKLLRVLETGRYMRVGSTQTMEADVRVIAASNRPLIQAVESGKLREDLLYRLNVFPIELPPLRDRLSDVPLLARHFLSAIGAKEGQHKQFSVAAMERLCRYRWPGNVRELRNAVQRAYVMATGELITDQWLPAPDLPAAPGGIEALPGGLLVQEPLPQGERGAAALEGDAATAGLGTLTRSPAYAVGGTADAALGGAATAMAGSATGESGAASAATPTLSAPAIGAGAAEYAGSLSGTSAGMAMGQDALIVPIGCSMAEIERRFILATLAHYKQHKERTAAVLGISLKTLYNRLKEYAATEADWPEGRS